LILGLRITRVVGAMAGFRGAESFT
jgi:hypothetical protein